MLYWVGILWTTLCEVSWAPVVGLLDHFGWLIACLLLWVCGCGDFGVYMLIVGFGVLVF